jgi:hypothetical protein
MGVYRLLRERVLRKVLSIDDRHRFMYFWEYHLVIRNFNLDVVLAGK